MLLDDLIRKIAAFKGPITYQTCKMDSAFSFDNEYICVKRVDTANKHGGENVTNGKQWSIIFEKKKDFTNLHNWKQLKNYYKNNLNITKVRTTKKKPSKLENCEGIRFYEMAKDPTNDIIYDILYFIFEK